MGGGAGNGLVPLSVYPAPPAIARARNEAAPSLTRPVLQGSRGYMKKTKACNFEQAFQKSLGLLAAREGIKKLSPQSA